MPIQQLRTLAAMAAALGLVLARPAVAQDAGDRIRGVHERFVFADMHAHPSRFHRADVDRIARDELARYHAGLIDLVVANVSSDAAYQGGYVARDGTRVDRLPAPERHPLAPGEAFAFTLDRLDRVLRTIESGDAVLASSPGVALSAKQNGRLAIIPALEGADGLEGDVENLRELHRRGLRLVQLVHFLDNELGHNQTEPYTDGGLTDFGREVVREANRLGIVVDLAHANTRTILDAIEVSEHPIVFSHGGVKALHEGDRYVTDEEIVAIGRAGGVVGIWPTQSFGTIEEMVRHIDHVRRIAGIDHVGIGSDLRGMSYLDAFGEEANFLAIVDGLVDAGYTDDEIGKVMGGNFFRVWEEVSEPDHSVPSRPETVSWGWFPVDKEPVLRIQSGERVRINTLTHAGATQDEEPVAYLTGLGVPRDEILEDVLDFWASREGRPREGRSGHVITGPIYVEGADPGDVLEIEILDVETRVPWGVNNTSARGGVFSTSYPGFADGDPALDIPPGTRHLIRAGDVDGREVAVLSGGAQVPLAPFMGILAVAPDPVVGQPGVTVPGVQSSRPPGAFGGNLDVKDLVAGTKVYLPVFHPGALFYVGDPHGAQGDGEVSGTAIEQSLTGTFRLTVREDMSITAPRAENDTHWMIMGIDLDLDRATRNAVWEVVRFLEEEKGMTHADALSFASIAVDFRVSEVVDLTQVVTGFVPKGAFVR
jgi:acetamidase/formamidase/microsomal dipeptidase-like Zn-dependent dipeptidase